MILEYAYKFDGDLFKELLDGIPKGKYFDNRGDIIPVQAISEFRVKTDFPNELHYVSVVSENGQNINTTIIPDSKAFVLPLKLAHGLNTVTILHDENNYASKSVSCTYFGTLLYAYAQSINGSVVRMDRVVRDIYQQESTRISSPVQHYAKQLPEKKAQRIFGLQLITRALINSPGTFESLEDICKAIYISTPIIEDVEYKNVFDLSYYSFAGQEYELGKIVYLWVRNPSLVRRLYGLILARNYGIPTIDTDSTLENEEGFNEYKDNDNALIVDDNGYTEYDKGNEDSDSTSDGYLEIEFSIDMQLPRLDRNLPIPFTINHPWHDKTRWETWEHLDTPRSLDIATEMDPFNDGMLMKQEIPYRYDGSKVTSLVKVMKSTNISVGYGTLETISD